MKRTGTLFLKALFILCIVFIIGVTLGINSKKSNDTVYEDTLKEEKQETVVKAKPTTVEELINKETKFKPNYNKNSKVLTLNGNYTSNLGSEKGLFLARYSAYESVKLCEETFPNNVESYVINFYHDTVDKYGNKKDTKVYSLVLCEDELSKVNWNNIDSSMLSDLGEEYINPVIFRYIFKHLHFLGVFLCLKRR